MPDGPAQSEGLLRALDFIYTPSEDVARDVAYFTDVLGSELFFAIDDMGTRVAMLRLTPGGQRIAIYEPTRSFVVESFAGRRDF